MLLTFFLTAGLTAHSRPALAKQKPAGKPKAAAKRPARALPPRLVPPPNVQNYHRYGTPDQQDFSTAESAGREYAPVPAGAGRGPQYQLKKGAVIFGWHPYWMGNAYVTYDFALLTHVAYYGYQANDRGELTLPAPASLGPAGLIAQAHQKNPACKVLLTIAYPAAEGATSLLRPVAAAAQERLLQAIVGQVAASQADGVNLDFGPPDEKPTTLTRKQLALAKSAAALEAQQAQLAAGELQLQEQQEQLAPGIDPATGLDSALVLAAEKEALDSVGLQISAAQKALAKDVEAHKLAQKKLLHEDEFWGFVKRWLYLEKETAAHARTAARLAQRQVALRNQAQANRRRLKLNAIETKKYAARQASQQKGLSANQALVAQSQEQQAALKAQQARKELAEQAVQRRAQSYGPGVPRGMQPLTTRAGQLQDFIARLAVRLRAKNPASVVTLSVPAVDHTQTYQNLRAVEPLVALFIIKAFDYTIYNQVVPGALAPLNPSEAGGAHSVSTSVAYYLKQGSVQRRQLLVGFPHLAKVWQMDSLNGQEVADLRPAAYWTNQQLRPFLPTEAAKPDLTSLSRTATLAPERPGQLAPQTWWEDSVSLAPKYAWLNKQHLAGVGIWALGYDDGSPQVWNLLRASFTEPVPMAKKPAAAAPQSLLDKVYGVRHVILLSLVVVLGFLGAGLLLALFLRADDLVPNPPLLSVVGLLLGLCVLCVGLYAVVFGQLVLTAWMMLALGGGALLLLLLVYQRYWRRQILP